MYNEARSLSVDRANMCVAISHYTLTKIIRILFSHCLYREREREKDSEWKKVMLHSFSDNIILWPVFNDSLIIYVVVRQCAEYVYKNEISKDEKKARPPPPYHHPHLAILITAHQGDQLIHI